MGMKHKKKSENRNIKDITKRKELKSRVSLEQSSSMKLLLDLSKRSDEAVIDGIGIFEYFNMQQTLSYSYILEDTEFEMDFIIRPFKNSNLVTNSFSFVNENISNSILKNTIPGHNIKFFIGDFTDEMEIPLIEVDLFASTPPEAKNVYMAKYLKERRCGINRKENRDDS